jgi:hypothetical protein
MLASNSFAYSRRKLSLPQTRYQSSVNGFELHFCSSFMEKIINKFSSKLDFSTHLNYGYFCVANFLRKIILLLATGSFSKFLPKKPNVICCALNSIH